MLMSELFIKSVQNFKRDYWISTPADAEHYVRVSNYNSNLKDRTHVMMFYIYQGALNSCLDSEYYYNDSTRLESIKLIRQDLEEALEDIEVFDCKYSMERECIIDEEKELEY